MNYPPDSKVWCPMCKGWVLLNRQEEHNRTVHVDIFGPEEKRPKVVIQSWSEHAKALMKSQQEKIQHIIANNCIEYEGGGCYVCRPIPHYNKTTYRMKEKDGQWSCTCQFNRQTGEMCAHLGALYQFWHMKAIK